MWHCLSPSLAPSDHLQVALSPCLCLWLRLISAGSFPFKPDAAFSAPLCCVSIGCSRERGSVSVRGRLCFLGLSALIMEFLLGNPFSTPLGQRIERATCSSLSSEDWALNMEICDVINSSEEGPRDAVRAIRKRIVGNKNFKEVLLALTVLETCVKNCGYRFHILVTTRDFIEGVLVRSIVPRNNPPLVLHDRVLSIIQAWADAFRSSPDLTGVVSVYEDLRRKGLEFPMTELDGYSPVQAPKKTAPGNGPAVTTLPAALLSSKPPLIPPQTSELKLALQGTGAFTPSQVKRLKAELGVVRSNLTMMSDMMSQLDPVTVKQADMELLELYTVCKEMQDRIVKIVPRLSEEKLIEELLATNDEMNTAFTRYHRFERRITNGQNASHKSHSYSNLTDLELTAESLSSSGVASFTRNSSLSHSKSDSLSSHLAKLSTSESDDTLSQKPQQAPSDHGEVVVDGLARAQDSRLQNTGTDDSPASTRSSSPKLDWMIKRGMIPINQSNVMDDIEKWLELDDDYDDFEDSDGVTSAEFDRFLAERAKAAERLPSLRASSQDTNQSES
ncbi:target of Myb protein 1 isoform X2 [Anabas testudineus]|uniref:target of Myb protein 1 isoform X2 n=1 Tax=Anabas testudineus TaxID=64144 RepID=UPI000E45E77C|nr:target of Myb protein 1 isoform X2 [Anabas testudineus]